MLPFIGITYGSQNTCFSSLITRLNGQSMVQLALSDSFHPRLQGPQGLKNLSQDERLKYALAIVSNAGDEPKKSKNQVSELLSTATELSSKDLFNLAKTIVNILGKHYGYKVVKK